jgi:hypothetical protein
MTALEVSAVVFAVINVILLLLLFNVYREVSRLYLYIKQTHDAQGSIVVKLLGLEAVLGKIAAGFSEMVAASEDLMDKIDMTLMPGPQIYQTTDGKYVAPSIDELINKIRKDKSEKKYFSEEELYTLKSMFAENEKDFFDDDSDETEEDEDEDENK